MPTSPSPRFKHRDIRLTAPIKAAPQRVYASLTSARELCSWWLERAETDARNAGRVRMVWPAVGKEPPREARGMFVDLEPGRKAAWLWEGARGVPPLNTFFIEPVRVGSRVTLLHAGFSAAAAWDARFVRWQERWEDCLAKLTLYLEAGKTCKADRLSLAELAMLRRPRRRRA